MMISLTRTIYNEPLPNSNPVCVRDGGQLAQSARQPRFQSLACAQSIIMNSNWLLALRLCVGAVWIYEGLWMKILSPDPHELEIVTHFSFLGLTGASLMAFIGALECLLGLGFWSGYITKFVAWTGITVLLAMNISGILGGGGTIASPIGLLIKNTPLWCCMGLLAAHGAGKWRLPVLKRFANGNS